MGWGKGRKGRHNGSVIIMHLWLFHKLNKIMTHDLLPCMQTGFSIFSPGPPRLSFLTLDIYCTSMHVSCSCSLGLDEALLLKSCCCPNASVPKSYIMNMLHCQRKGYIVVYESIVLWSSSDDMEHRLCMHQMTIYIDKYINM